MNFGKLVRVIGFSTYDVQYAIEPDNPLIQQNHS